MNSTLMFSKASDEWSPPLDLYVALDAEFHFTCDVAGQIGNRKCLDYFGPDHADFFRRDALTVPWSGVCFLNPPYSQVRAFMTKAATEAAAGVLVVALVPARTDTRWWHDQVWDKSRHIWRPGVEVRFLKGRVKFGDEKNSAPFPSVVIVFRPRDFKRDSDESSVTYGSDQDDEHDRAAAVHSKIARRVHGAVARDRSHRLDGEGHASGGMPIGHE
jgi:phage N-6-adenine-methyltransferase